MSSYYNINRAKPKRSAGSRLAVVVIFLVLVLAAGYGGIFYVRSSEKATPDADSLQPNQQVETEEKPPEITIPMPWPKYGQAAYGVPEIEVYAASNLTNKQAPIASLAKVITVLAILKEKPLAPGEQGPTLTMTQEDVDLFNEYLAKDGTVVPVEVGSQITLYQALQATMHISANNMSDTLARWAFGSDKAYVDYANNMLKEMGINDTVVDDASGFSPDTVSTAEDMTKIGYLYMQNPVLKEIALQKNSVVPIAGKINNANYFANGDGVVGIKIGFIEEAGRTYMAADISPENPEQMSVAVVLGAEDFITAAKDARKILKTGNIGYELKP